MNVFEDVGSLKGNTHGQCLFKQASYYSVKATNSLTECKALCFADATCTGMDPGPDAKLLRHSAKEFSGGRCEIWAWVIQAASTEPQLKLRKTRWKKDLPFFSEKIQRYSKQD